MANAPAFNCKVRHLLEGIRVVEVAGRASGRVAGWHLASIGADVVRIVENGTPDLDLHPAFELADASIDVAWDRHKRLIQVSKSQMRNALTEVTADADILITSGENAGEADPLAVRRFDIEFDGVHVDLSPFGSTGPCRDFRATDLNVCSYGGLAAYIGEAGDAPLVPPLLLSAQQAGLAAAIGSVATLGVKPAAVEVAEFDVMATVHQVGLYSIAFFLGPIPRRAGRRKAAPYPFTLLPCRDGWACLAFLENWHWQRFLDVMGSPSWAKEERYASRRRIGELYADEVDQLMGEWLMTKTRAELRVIALQHRLPIASLRSVDEVIDLEQLASRCFFERIEVDGRDLRLPLPPFRVTTGQHRDNGGASRRGRPQHFIQASDLKVLDLGRVIAGPAIGQWLADLGADVIKVESRTHLDSARKGLPLVTDAPDIADHDWKANVQPHFNSINRGKRSIVLDLANPCGQEALLALVNKADVVIENFGAGSLERLGLPCEKLLACRPGLTVVRVSAAGQRGPDAAAPGYAPQSTASAGLDALCGYSCETEPIGMISANFGDINTAMFGALAVLAAASRRRDESRGWIIDLSMLEANALHVAPQMVAVQKHGTAFRPQGNNHRVYCPHGIYRCKGPDAWVSVAVRTREEWCSLCAAIGATDLLGDLDDAELRRRRVDEIDACITKWTLQRSPMEATLQLQRCGVPAAPTLGVEDLLFDAHVRERGLVVEVEHPIMGVVPVYGCPLRINGDRMRVRGPAPDLGEHTQEVMEEHGFRMGRILQLAAEGAFDGPFSTGLAW